jgi:predicted RNase H-like HicB family nuclease
MAIVAMQTRGSEINASFAVAGASEEMYIAPTIEIETLQWQPSTGTRICRGWFTKEQDGRYSAVAANLPGVCSQGDSIEDAKRNLAEAFRGALEEYQAAALPIPWAVINSDNRPANALEAWIVVNG